MTKDEKINMMQSELKFLSDINVINVGKYLIGLLPDYFFKVAASSTGKYHPSFSLGDGGLLRHTKCATRIANELLELEMFQSKLGDKKDIILLSIMLHDGLKHGKQTNASEYTVFEHPIIMADFIEENKNELTKYISEKDITLLEDCIKTHMGQWTKNYDGVEVLEKPKSKYQKFVHLCDYLSSRKFLDVKFDDHNNISIW